MSDLVICKFRKSMVIHDTECPHWDQMSLNNPNPNTTVVTRYDFIFPCVSLLSLHFSFILNVSLSPVSVYRMGNHDCYWHNDPSRALHLWLEATYIGLAWWMLSYYFCFISAAPSPTLIPAPCHPFCISVSSIYYYITINIWNVHWITCSMMEDLASRPTADVHYLHPPSPFSNLHHCLYWGLHINRVTIVSFIIISAMPSTTIIGQIKGLGLGSFVNTKQLQSWTDRDKADSKKSRLIFVAYVWHMKDSVTEVQLILLFYWWDECVSPLFLCHI